MTIDSRILDKITKCLSLANDSRGDPATAAIALRQAQALMRQHNVTEDGLAAASCDHESLRSAFSVSQPKPYETNLMRVVSQAFGCEVVWTSSSSHASNVFGSFTLIGPKSGVTVDKHAAVVLQRQLVKARADFVRTHSHLTSKAKTVEADGFCVGWVQAVRKTVDAFADPDGTVAKARAAYKLAYYGCELSSRDVPKRQLGQTGLRAGFEEGGKVSLRRGMGAPDQTLAIGG